MHHSYILHKVIILFDQLAVWPTVQRNSGPTTACLDYTIGRDAGRLSMSTPTTKCATHIHTYTHTHTRTHMDFKVVILIAVCHSVPSGPRPCINNELRLSLSHWHTIRQRWRWWRWWWWCWWRRWPPVTSSRSRQRSAKAQVAAAVAAAAAAAVAADVASVVAARTRPPLARLRWQFVW